MSEAEALSDWLEGEDERPETGLRKPRRTRSRRAVKSPAAPQSTPIVVTEPGFYEMAAETYHADPVAGGSLSQSGAKLLLKSPAKFKWERQHPSTPTRSMNLGTAAHSMVLGTGPALTVIPEDLLASNGAVSTKAAKEFRDEAIAAGMTVVSAAELATITAMAKALRTHPIAGPLFERAGVAERAMFWRDPATDVWRRALVDWTTTVNGHPTLCDYKTAVDVSPDAFSRAVRKYGYHQQDDWYRDGYEVLSGTSPDFLFIAQETTPPYLVAVYQLDAYAQRIAATENARAIELFARCTETDTWPGYDEDVTLLALPPWAEHEYEMEVDA